MAIQTRNGKAFEYATLLAMQQLLYTLQKLEILENSAYVNARESYSELNSKQQNDYLNAALAAIRILIKFEPQLNNHNGNEPLIISIQEDSAGISGDVRDIITVRKQNNWEIGVSCKHNHKAVKHSRLSDKNDFGMSWFNIPCSKNYFESIASLFEELRIKKNNKELWADIIDKDIRFYQPLLQSFIAELKSLDTLNPGIIPQRLIQYLIGRNDFYKIITNDKRKVTHIDCFNLYGTLNRKAGNIKPELSFKKLKLPTKFHDISFKDSSLNTILVTCDNGWSISMRIHNASSKVEPSLKFDVNLVGNPSEMFTTYERWEQN